MSNSIIVSWRYGYIEFEIEAVGPVSAQYRIHRHSGSSEQPTITINVLESDFLAMLRVVESDARSNRE
jgi:hypothetical protein